MSGPRNNLSILVVEPDEFVLHETVTHLARAVSKVFSATNASSALSIVQNDRPDIILTDLVLPDMGGEAFVTQLRTQDQDVPIMVTYDGYSPSALLKVMDQNISAFLKKPLHKETLYEQLWRVAKVVLLRQKLFQTRSLLERTIDLFPAFVLLVQEDSVSFINRRMLSFLGFNSYMDMLEQGHSLDDYITELNGKPYESGEEGWIRKVLDDPLDRDHLIKLSNPRHPQDEGRVLVLSFNEFNQPDTFLFIFSDVSEMQDERVELEGHASLDPLTGAFNRRKFIEFLAVQEMYFATSGQPVSIIMFDIDHFKLVNDNHGHDIGDSVLQEICNVVRAGVRESDKLGRWGGEEFMVLLANADLRQARSLAERLRQAVEEFDFTGLPGGLTSSFGVAQWRENETRAAFLKRVDEALYKAKKSGRNRVVAG